MREILFRGKRVDNGEWTEGYFIYCKSEWEDESGRTAEIIPREADRICKGEYYPYDVYEVDPETVGQFTGLTDKNGRRIFEGDIVDMTGEWWDASGPAGYNSPITSVKWDKYICGFSPFANYDCDCGVYIEASGCEVIGNIHDNPELMDGKA